jgi:DNA replication protein DnaC
MSLQSQRVQDLCESLALLGLEAEYGALSQAAAEQESSYTDYLEQCLKSEKQSRLQRTQTMLLKMAGFPAIKQL